MRTIPKVTRASSRRESICTARPTNRTGCSPLPRTYFVQILGETAQFYYVSYLTDRSDYKAVKGYCKKTEIVPVDYTPVTPFLEYKITVTYSVDGSFLPDDPLSTFTAEVVYYGEFNFGTSVYYYVNRDGAFGYVPAKSCSKPEYPVNTEHTEVNKPDTGQGTVSAQGNAVRIVLICTLGRVRRRRGLFSLPARKRRRKAARSLYDENENY